MLLLRSERGDLAAQDFRIARPKRKYGECRRGMLPTFANQEPAEVRARFCFEGWLAQAIVSTLAAAGPTAIDYLSNTFGLASAIRTGANGGRLE